MNELTVQKLYHQLADCAADAKVYRRLLEQWLEYVDEYGAYNRCEDLVKDTLSALDEGTTCFTCLEASS